MIAKYRSWIAPAYLFACLTMGGSGQGVWSNAALQLAGVAIIGLALLHCGRSKADALQTRLWWLVAGVIGLILLQLVPLPPAIWQMLPGRHAVADGDALLDLGLVWRPISLSPADTVEALVTLIPPVAMVVAVTRLGGHIGWRLAVAAAVAATVGLLLGLLQLSAAEAGGDGWYLYPRSNFGVATGFFANGNHMAAMLLCLLPLSAAAVEQASAVAKDRQRYWMIVGFASTMAVVALVGLLFNASLFGLAMMVPVAVASLLVAFRHSIGRRGRIRLAVAAAVLMIGGVAVGADHLARSGPVGASVSVSTRADIAKVSAVLVERYFPAGSGVGTFEAVYASAENPTKVDRFYVNHAHNDYLEWIVEAGLAGLVLLLLFLRWWGRLLLTMLADHRATGYAQAGGIIGAVLLAHSLVDFPMRTAALAVMFAMATGLMMASRRLPRKRKDLRPTRHVTIG